MVVAKHLSIRLDEQIYQKIVRLSEENSLKISDCIRGLIQTGLGDDSSKIGGQRGTSLDEETLWIIKIGVLAAKESLTILRQNYLTTEDDMKRIAFQSVNEIRQEMSAKFPDRYNPGDGQQAHFDEEMKAPILEEAECD